MTKSAGRLALCATLCSLAFTGTSADTQAVPGAEGHSIAMMDLLSGKMADFDPGRFLADRSLLSGRLVLPPDVSDAQQRAELLADLAAFHMAHGFWIEARSILSALQPEGLTGSLRSSVARLALAADLLDPLSRAAPAQVKKRLTEEANSWPDAPLFRALSEARSDGTVSMREDLETASRMIAPYPAPVRARALPILLEASLLMEEWEIARSLGLLLQEIPGFFGSPADDFLQGLGSEKIGLIPEALDSYATAAEGADIWAQRARIAHARLALAAGVITREEARDSLAMTRFKWRGGELGLSVLRSLADLEKEMENPIGALDALAEIVDRHPDRAAEVAPESEKWTLVKDFYDLAVSGEIGFSEALDGHRRLASDYGIEAPFTAHAEVFAEYLFGLGARRLAAEEYRRISDAIQLRSALGRGATSDFEADRIRLRWAEIVIGSGQAGEALEILSKEMRDAQHFRRQQSLRAAAFMEMGNHDAVLKTGIPIPEARHRQLIARAHLRIEDWDGARLHYLSLLASGDLAGDPDEIGNLVVAAHRAGHIETDAALILELAQDDLTPGQRNLIDAVLASGKDTTPLAVVDLRDHIETVAVTLEAARAARDDQR